MPGRMGSLLATEDMEKAMSYVIVTDSRNQKEILFMVDRSIQRASFWSNSTDDALVFADKSAAERKAKSLKFNRPRVMALSDARRISLEAERERDHQAAMWDMEAGWDGHKGSF